MKVEVKREKRYRRHRRIRAKIKGTNKIPRLFVFRSSKHIYAQLIDDEKGHTIISASDINLKESKTKSQKGAEKEKRGGKVAIAYKVGQMLAKKAAERRIKKVVFDRGGYKYHGRVKAVADGAREQGLKF